MTGRPRRPAAVAETDPGKTATHLAERIMVMVAGRIEAETTASALADDPVMQRRYLGVDTIEAA